MTKLAEAIAHEEGFYVEGSLPQRNNNPGDLRHGNGEVHPANQPNSVGAFATPEDGWAALERQLGLDASRGWTMQQLVYSYAPPSENDTPRYLAYVLGYTGATENTLVSDALLL